MVKSTGQSDVEAALGKEGLSEESVPGGWIADAAAAIINGLYRIITAGHVPAEVHVDGSKIQELRQTDIYPLVEKSLSGVPNREVALQMARWWDQNRHQLVFVPREGFMYPTIISVAEQAEATVFTAVLQHLQSLGLDRALQDLGLDIQTVMKSPKLFQDTIWFQFQLLLHSRLSQSRIIVPGAVVPEVKL